jgi:hypothetical protein
MAKKIQLKRFRDKTDKFVVKKSNGMFDLPARVMICGSSGSGKTQMLLSLLLSDDAYLNDFKGENIYIWSPMINDAKLEYLIEKKKIPSLNIFTEYDENLLSQLYDTLCEQTETEKQVDEMPTQKLIVFDDVGFSGGMASKKQSNNIISKLMCNSRKHSISVFSVLQDYFQMNKTSRINLTGVILFNCNNRALEQVEIEHNYLKDKNTFKDMVRNNLNEKHDFVVINYSNTRAQGLYLNLDFEKIG